MLRAWADRLSLALTGPMLAGMLLGCGGGGGATNQSPIANAGPDQTAASGATVTLSGATSSDSDGMIATYAWSQSGGVPVTLSSSSTQSTTFAAPNVAANALLTFNLTVTDNGGLASATADTVNVTVTPPSINSVIAGRVTYDRVPFYPVNDPVRRGLDYLSTQPESAAGITVQARDVATSTTVTTTRTDANGDYSVVVPTNAQITIRALAEMIRGTPEALPHWNIAVRNGIGASEPYSFSSAAFNSGAPGGAQNLSIPSGWNPVSRQPLGAGSRHAAPFAILDTIRRSVDTVLAVAPATSFPRLTIDWSDTKPAGQTFYSNDAGGDNRRISLSGEANTDIDEYDAHTIAHEFGHYVEDRFSRSDSVGGPHGAGDRLDPRVAFGEGFGYAFAAIVLDDPVVRDAFGNLQSSEGRFSVEADGSQNEGWFSEASSQEILWDLFDATNESGDAIALGFAPFWQLLAGAQRTTDAMTTLFPFVSALKAQLPSQAAQINQIVNNEVVLSNNIDPFGTDETNSAGTTDVLPIYTPISMGQTRPVRSVVPFGPGNKLSNRRFLRFDALATRIVSVAVSGPPGQDVDALVYQRGAIVAAGTSPENLEAFTFQATAGTTYIIEVYDCANAGCSGTQYSPTPTNIDVTLN